NGREVIVILHGGFCHIIHHICDIESNANVTRISPPISITPFLGSTLAWPDSNQCPQFSSSF
ncbi:hypothetical protein O181_104295, partial [Austropuccinia psidii MF-1]|nr:hypothetical protein [Austropuccinia psidii MF-1]